MNLIVFLFLHKRRAFIKAVFLLGAIAVIGFVKEVPAQAPAFLSLNPQKAITQYSLDLWHYDQGLPQSAVQALAQTADGYLWIGFEEGLARFDGVRYGLRVRGSGLHEMISATRDKGFGREVKRRILLGTFVLSAGYYDAYYLKAQKVRTLIRQDFQKAFETCDALITPVAPTTAFRIGEKITNPLDMYLSDVHVVAVNLAGIPALTVPCGFSNGLPIGMQIIGRRNADKARLLYDAIEGSDGWYRPHARSDSRSLMNVTFRLPSEDLEKQFDKEATANGLDGLKGHRSVGGMRASIYNAFPEEGVDALVQFMREFERKQG